ncbi:ROK family protein [Thermoactinomyces mirandus]|uniref:ROK family protein n=1 Tax=Thermoactinomyces mirandus TaxID=2756294 RepID=A0A7W1XTZ2_9BACL|nr:ROK family protein [Thermoactinomyces mirandus]MBA4603243.1 ROK family protein [Thermoactinomyces mirandus]
MAFAIGVDIGGTKTAIAAVDHTGKIWEQAKIPTDLSISPKTMIKRIHREIDHILTVHPQIRQNVTGIGIGAPGPLDSGNGMIKCPPNLPDWRDVPIRQWMEERWGWPAILENDANAAAMAEQWLGAGKNDDHFVYMTISTGIGAGIVTDGRLLRGKNGNAGDIGHMVVDPSFGKCTCGQEGCLESIASGTAIAKRASEILEKQLTTREVFALYHEGIPEIVRFIEQVFRVLGIACVTLINTFEPDKIIIGGGVSKAGEPLFAAIRNYVGKYALSPDGQKTDIVPAMLDQNAGVIGAAALCFHS